MQPVPGDASLRNRRFTRGGMRPPDELRNCDWRMVDVARNVWKGACSLNTRFFAIGGPMVNGFPRCPYCGGHTREKLGA
jgi:hypothetical protein